MAKGFHDERYRRAIEALIEARRAAGLSQHAVAIRLGQHQQFVSRYETGERRLDFIEVLDVAAALKVDILALLSQVQSDRPIHS